MKNLEEIKEWLWSLLMEYGPKVLLAIVTLIIGLWVISKITSVVRRVMEKRDVDSSLRPFLGAMVNVTLKLLLALTILTMVGVAVTSFIAILAAAGFAIGMALSGTLQNFAGGVMILLFKPFKVDDLIEAQGYLGVVKEIQIFNTYLLTLDNKTVIIPNGPLSTGPMVNFSTEPTRRVDLEYGIAYGDKVEKARETLKSIIAENNQILKDPAPFIGLATLGDSSVNLTCRVWCRGPEYWDVYFAMNEEVYNRFNAEGIQIPFPQMDVHMHN